MRHLCGTRVWGPRAGGGLGDLGRPQPDPGAHDTEFVRKVWKKMVLLTSVDRGQAGPTGHSGHRHRFHVDPKCKHGVRARRNG